jgi:hypothetical protein
MPTGFSLQVFEVGRKVVGLERKHDIIKMYIKNISDENLVNCIHVTVPMNAMIGFY